MRFVSLTWALLALAGCGGGKDSGGKVCETCDCIEHPEVKKTWPEDGATGVYNRTQFHAVVDDDTDFTTAISMVDGSGTQVDGTFDFDPDEGLVTWTATTPLAPSTDYTMALLTNGECENDSVSFTTSDVGTPIADLNSLVDRTWRMSLNAGSPPIDRGGLASVIDMVEEDLLIHATALNGTTLSATVASSLGPGEDQNLCIPTIEIELDLSANPFATGDVPAGYAPLSGQAVPTFGGEVSGSFSPDGSTLAGIDLTMIQDMDAASVIMNDDLCTLLPNLGVSCESCPSGSGNCLTFNTWGVDGVEDTAVVVTPRSDADVGADASCQ